MQINKTAPDSKDTLGGILSVPRPASVKLVSVSFWHLGGYNGLIARRNL
jgi:hypothetical protein